MTAPTRRDFLSHIGSTFGIAAMGHVALKSGLLGTPAEARVRGQDNLPPDLGAGRKVAVLGAGVSGLRAAWELAAGGFDVTVIEAAPVMGGRSQTIRPSSAKYKAHWLAQPNQSNFPPSAYHDTIYQEVYDDTGAYQRTEAFRCEFRDDAWENGQVAGDPVEIYLNAGPGRIPSFHNALLDHCRKFDVVLEPFTFVSRNNLVQKDGFNGGDPARLGAIKHSLREEIERILAALPDGQLSALIGDADVAAFREMLVEFGGGDPAGSDRRGYQPGITPGAWFNNGTPNPAFDLPDILDASAWTPGLFSDMRIYWQTSLMQPTGGMDRVWANVLTKPLPQGGTIEDRVAVGMPVTRILKTPGGLQITWGAGAEARTGTFEFCVSTMSARQLSLVVDGFGPRFPDLLSQVRYDPSCKVGWQSRGRWFEDDYAIYGGISWIAPNDDGGEDSLISQVWYPSQDFHSRTATLTGAYNRGPQAQAFGRLSHPERLAKAVAGGAKLHGVSEQVFRDHFVYFDRGLSVAWQNAPYQDGGWASHEFESRRQRVVERGVETGKVLWDELVSQPVAPLYLAGDCFSHTPGWKEGAIRTAMAAVYAIAERCAPAKMYNGGAGGTCRYERLFDG